MRLVLAGTLAGLVASACAHTVTNEQRLDGMTDVVVDSNADAAELRCRDTAPEVQLARDRTQKKAERLARYQWAIADAKATAARFEEAFRKDPDLVYGPEAGEWRRRQQGCTELALALEKERARAELEPDLAPVEKPAVVEKPAKADKVDKVEKRAKSAPARAKVEESAQAAADEAFDDDADQLRAAYKKKAKVAKAKKKALKKKRRAVSLAAR